MSSRRVILFPLAAPAEGHAMVFGEDFGPLQGDLARGLTVEFARLIDTWPGVSTSASWMLLRAEGADGLLWSVNQSLMTAEGLAWLAAKQPEADFVISGRLRLEDGFAWEVVAYDTRAAKIALARRGLVPLVEIVPAIESFLAELARVLVEPGERVSWALPTRSGEAYVHYCIGLGHVKALELDAAGDAEAAFQHLGAALAADLGLGAARAALDRLVERLMAREKDAAARRQLRRGLDQLIEAGHAAPALLRQRGRLELEADAPAEAMGWLRRALAAGDDAEPCCYLLAKGAEALHDWREMAGWTSRLTSLAPDEPGHHLLHGIACIHADRPDEAIASWRRALELDADLQAAHANIALALLGLGRLDDAVAEIDAVLDGHEFDPDFLRVAAVVLQEAGQAGRARSLIDDVVEGADLDAHDLLLAGRVYQQLGEPARAREMFEQVLALDPDREEGDLAARMLCAIEEPGFEAAFQRVADEIAQRRSAVVLGRLAAWADRYPFYWHVGYLHGIALWQAGRAGEARLALERAARQRPDQPEILHTLSHVLLELGEVEPARHLAQRAVSLAPEDAGKHSNLAMILAYGRDYRAALAHQQQAVRIDPADPLARLIRPLIARIQEQGTFPFPSAGALPEELLAPRPAGPGAGRDLQGFADHDIIRPGHRRSEGPRRLERPFRILPRTEPWWRRWWNALRRAFHG